MHIAYGLIVCSNLVYMLDVKFILAVRRMPLSAYHIVPNIERLICNACMVFLSCKSNSITLLSYEFIVFVGCSL